MLYLVPKSEMKVIPSQRNGIETSILSLYRKAIKTGTSDEVSSYVLKSDSLSLHFSAMLYDAQNV